MMTWIPASSSSFIAFAWGFVGSIVSHKSAHAVGEEPCEPTDKKSVDSQLLEEVHIIL
jgi:hypothetical protein